MAILIDTPRWPAHGTTWAHVVSDVSLEELHTFARRTGLPSRSFDLDHYDVPAHRHAELVTAGASPVSGRDLIRRLAGSGLRVRSVDRPAARERRRQATLKQRWTATAGPAPGAAGVGAELLRRWTEPHRHYHATAHLLEVLERLDELSAAGEPVSRRAELAAWFHDAVHEGTAGEDERRSADLVTDLGPAAGLGPRTVAEVRRLVLLTAGHAPDPGDRDGAALCDADLAVLAAPPERYRAYTAAVRREYAHLDAPTFARGRAQVLRSLLAGRMFTTGHAHARWEPAARQNVRAELERLEDAGQRG
ncbi:DUF4031 domain-containing protein [Georgenia sp. 10Sc9-8]|uniref:DUF4031 domain-containing protein n=1 Tax=Georgenia halotolerans TaxID=3028317 RepID=A0ABT5TVK7_9MICO|nr:DUF4031 domain-containing protein [Georgenia halotolerans]